MRYITLFFLSFFLGGNLFASIPLTCPILSPPAARILSKNQSYDGWVVVDPLKRSAIGITYIFSNATLTPTSISPCKPVSTPIPPSQCTYVLPKGAATDPCIDFFLTRLSCPRINMNDLLKIANNANTNSPSFLNNWAIDPASLNSLSTLLASLPHQLHLTNGGNGVLRNNACAYTLQYYYEQNKQKKSQTTNINFIYNGPFDENLKRKK